MNRRYGGRRWTELYHELPYTALPEIRRQAEGWRNGLGALTALVGLLAVFKGRDDLTKLPDSAGRWALGLTAFAFVLLVLGTLLATEAAHGTPVGGSEYVTSGAELHKWTEDQLTKARRSLTRAARCCLVALLAVFAAVVLGWAATESPDTHLVRVRTPTGDRCGEFLGQGRGGVRLETGEGKAKKEVVVPLRNVRETTPVDTC
ncbi:hypothetical protein [Streptomyces sp. NPDC047046]|uniref:hypothetical protein n=1 Tax=Streptomyces sp. NPDC047046 TaxID=3155378 RepID=UPI0033CADE5C